MKKKKIISVLGLISNFVSAIILSFSIKIVDPMKDCGATVQFCGNDITLSEY
ncbi:MAG: hypothetical protein MAG795_00652 [Candidatus Woesearchaeota archaeon]|nr:hypothetical protein [Candidatus Woesearchaeota archaeon]